MKYESTLIVVADMERAKQFYHDVLGLEVILDFGANATLTGGIALQTKETWAAFIHKTDGELVFGGNVAELYFEEDDFDGFMQKLAGMAAIQYVHPVEEYPWGQRVVRFYDPDRHIIEVGEDMTAVVKRFVASGLSIEETAVKMDVPVDYVSACLR